MSDLPQVPAGYRIVTEADLKTLQEVWKLQNELVDHPVHGLPLKKAMKDIRPNLRIPEIDVAEPLLAPIRTEMEALRAKDTARDAEIAALKQEREDEKATGKLVKDLGSAQSRYRLTDEGMAEVKKLMVERNIADPHAAAALVASEIEPAKVVTGSNFGPADLNVLGMDGKAEDDSTKRLHEDPVKWQDREIDSIMREFDQQDAA